MVRSRPLTAQEDRFQRRIEMITYRSILEGNPPNMLFWQLGGLGPYRSPGPEDFSAAGGRWVFGSADSRNAPDKPFASKQAPWLVIDYGKTRFSREREVNADIFKWETPPGRLTARRESNHMTEYPLKTAGDIRVWRFVQENICHRRNPGFSEEDAGNSLIMTFKWSPVQELFQFETGVENFYYFLADAPDEMAALIETMHRKNLEALSVGFKACPKATVFQLIENTTAAVLSPSVYREITLPHVRAYVDMAHEHGMKCIVHMCGNLEGLFDCFAETGMDGIHAVTPPPVGDMNYMTVREYFGDEFVIIGRLNAQLWIGKTTEEISEVLVSMIPEKLVRTPFALWITTDEIQPSRDDVLRIFAALKNYNKNLNQPG